LTEELNFKVQELARLAMSSIHSKEPFRAGTTRVPVSGKVFGVEEIANATQAVMEFWLTAGHFTRDFEKSIAKTVGMRHGFMVNSGSSANLIAVSTLTSQRLGERALKPRDEVITVAAGFPTTVTPILQNQLTPVYVDVDIETLVAKSESIEEAISPRTKAIVMAHTLGNPFNLELICEIAKKHNLWLIEDNCDALGGTYKGKKLGSFGDLSTLSFYPAHHITTGEGGAVLAKSAAMKPIVESFRDWGRDCWCEPGCDNTCLKRYEWTLGELPPGYDHKYTYSHLGYNLKSGDIQAAIGLAQLNRLETFIELRRRNWNYLKLGLQALSDVIFLPENTEGSDPSWFGFAITLRDVSPITRDDLVKFLNEKCIDTRLLFGGNLTRQPAFLNQPARIPQPLLNTDKVMADTFWIGVWPGLTLEMLDYVIEIIYLAFGRKL
jgi:CDP-6-deoxy-D-xylo-4-hexulose-3-dehydrase